MLYLLKLLALRQAANNAILTVSCTECCGVEIDEDSLALISDLVDLLVDTVRSSIEDNDPTTGNVDTTEIEALAWPREQIRVSAFTSTYIRPSRIDG